MKKTLATIASAFIMITSMSAFAIEKSSPLKHAASATAVSDYLQATTRGTTTQEDLFADSFAYSNTANGDSFDKKAYTDFLKAHQAIQFDCETSYTILDETGKTCIAKATMKFDNFTRVDYITLQQGSEGWKVSKVVTSYAK